MKRFYISLAILFTSLLAFVSVGSADTAVVEVQGQPMIITAVPAPKEVVSVPEGYVRCWTVPAGWNYSNVWVVEHRVCERVSSTGAAVEGVAWIDGYWSCSKYKTTGNSNESVCTTWDWIAGHYVKTLDVY